MNWYVLFPNRYLIRDLSVHVYDEDYRVENNTKTVLESLANEISFGLKTKDIRHIQLISTKK